MARLKALDLGLTEPPSPDPTPAGDEREAPAAAATITLEQAVYHYDDEPDAPGFALGPIDITLHPGELVFVVGGNGSGKSTFVKLLCGLYWPTTGVIRLNGEPITPATSGRFREQFAVVFSDFFLFDRASAHDGDAIDLAAKRYLETLDLGHKVTIHNGRFSTTTLSQGQRRRLALLSAYLEDRPVYIFDEWAADQDPQYRHVFYSSLLPDLKARGKTVVVITHDERYFDRGDRVVKLDYGRIVDTWRPTPESRSAADGQVSAARP